MIMLFIAVVVIFAVITTILIVKEGKNALLVDDKEPFLWDDYDPKKDETLK